MVLSKTNCEGYQCAYSKNTQELLHSEYGLLSDSGSVYLDHAGATLYSKIQLENIQNELLQNQFANPHSKSTASKATEDLIDSIRYQILDHFCTNPDEYSVVFTSGATESLKIVAENFDFKQDGELVYLQDNHTSVLGMREYAPNFRCLKSENFSNFKENTLRDNSKNVDGNSLFVYPAQSNFSGTKYPLEWIEEVQKGSAAAKWYCMLDAASFVSTNCLNLSLWKPDFVCMSFYKIFGFPTGIGALLIKNSSASVLNKKYFGGGTVYMALVDKNTVVRRENLHERFEDGTLNFLSIAALRHGFETLKRLNLNMDLISLHTFSLAKYTYFKLKNLKHDNGKPLCILYHGNEFQDSAKQGALINFNILRNDGNYIGFAEVMHMANLYNISLRTGCFCNLGACQKFLDISSQQVQHFYEMGHVCGDQRDLIDRKPTGSVRISFGFMSTKQDADKFLKMIEECFLKTCNTNIVNYAELFTKENSALGVLHKIYVFPIKSCAAFEAQQEWPLIDTGLQYDRQWMIVNENGTCLTQKHETRMCKIQPVLDVENGILQLSFEGFDFISVPLSMKLSKNGHGTQFSKVCGDKIQGWDCGDEVADWLDKVLDHKGLRLLKQQERNARKPKEATNQLSLANKAQFLLINKASVQWLYDRIPADAFQEKLQNFIARFRPNLLVDFGKPFIENEFDDFFIGSQKFMKQGMCTRCQMICIDQTSGEKSVEPLRTLSKEFEGKILFGIYLRQTDTQGSIAPAMKTLAHKSH